MKLGLYEAPALSRRSICRGLTLAQPLPWTILHAGSRVISRSRATAYRGPLALHAGLVPDDLRLRTWPPAVEAIRAWREAHPEEQLVMPAGAVLAVCRVLDCHVDDGCCRPWGDALEHHWLIGDVTPLRTPLPLRGNRGLFWIEESLATRLAAGLPERTT